MAVDDSRLRRARLSADSFLLPRRLEVLASGLLPRRLEVLALGFLSVIFPAYVALFRKNTRFLGAMISVFVDIVVSWAQD
jgi:hypothetical protein